jgi:hypothetical protein
LLLQLVPSLPLVFLLNSVQSDQLEDHEVIVSKRNGAAGLFPQKSCTQGAACFSQHLAIVMSLLIQVLLEGLQGQLRLHGGVKVFDTDQAKLAFLI